MLSDVREQYFLIAILDFLMEYDEVKSFAMTEVAGHCSGFVSTEELPNGISVGLAPLAAALETLVAKDILEKVEDEFAGSHFLILQRGRTLAESFLRSSCGKYQLYVRMGEEGADWLGRAFVGIERKGALRAQSSANLSTDEKWEPLQLDRQAQGFDESIAGIEDAIRLVAADNGFAVTYPAERESMLAHAEATLRSAKDGRVTKRQLRENILNAGKWLADKFAGTAIGTVGAELVKLGLKLLGFLS